VQNQTTIYVTGKRPKGHFTHETESPCRDHITSRTLIGGGKGGARPSSLHTALEGPTEYISQCEMDVKSTWIPTCHRIDHVST
jgi:hypothetical protein